MNIRNEAAVREEIVAPLLRALGYRSGTQDDIVYELSLQYPRNFLGRKKPSRDPELRGRADYICRAGGRIAWTIEAKPEDPGISENDVEQAYTYARHPEVRALYFCLCDGTEFRVYATDAAPTAGPIRTIKVDADDLRATARVLESLLAPRELLSRFASVAADTEPPIGPGLNSFAQITGGSLVYDDSAPLPELRGLTINVVGGAIQRLDGNGLLAYWEGSAPYASIQRTIKDLELPRIEARSSDRQLSIDPNAPTVFIGESSATFPRGRFMPNLRTHVEQELLVDLHTHVRIVAYGVLYGDRLRGPFELQWRYDVEDPDDPSSRSTVKSFTARGKFELALR